MEVKNELKALFTQYWEYLAINAAVKLELFDKVAEGQNTIAVLSTTNQWDVSTLRHLILFLVEKGCLVLENNVIHLTDKSELLQKTNDNGLYYACLHWETEHLDAWRDLEYTIKTGESAFEAKYGQAFFDFLDMNPIKLDDYHRAMKQYAIDDYKDLTKCIDFSQYQKIVDVGGGYGALITNVKASNPDSTCVLYDLENVVANIDLENIEVVGGSFFDKIPVGDAVLLSRVIHDWDDDKALKILKNCYRDMPLKGDLYLIENCTDLIRDELHLLSLNMKLICKSYERTSLEYVALCNQVGFKYKQAVKLNELQTILIFEK